MTIKTEFPTPRVDYRGHRSSMSRSFVLRPSAKINLTLRVGALRADGFHEVRTLLQSVALADTLTVTARDGPLVLAVRGTGVPDGRDNLVWRAAEALWTASGRTGDPRDAHVRLEKRIPTAAGLGGGSADAAAALVALNQAWQTRLSRRDLGRLAGSLGADVPFFFQGGTALGVGRGDELFPVDDIRRFGVVIIKPSFGVSTAEAYRWHDEALARGSDTPAPAGPEVDLGWPAGGVVLANDLEAPVAEHYPDVREMAAACRREGAIAAGMTGSGSAVFGLFSEAAARRASMRLQRPDWLVILTRTLGRREAAKRMGL